jgi:hypothetical protein
MKIAMITPSFRRDLERCRLLCNSVDKHVPQTVKHFLIVDHRDVPLFKSLGTERRDILVAEEMLPKWLFKMPFSKRWWLSLKSYPVRNWILQQILKLSISEFIDSDSYMFVDSDVFFIKEMPVNLFLQNNRVRLFRVPDSGRDKQHLQWHRNAGRLLRLPTKNYYGSDYIGNMITWRRDVLRKLHEHLFEQCGKEWQVSLARTLYFSEYILYGLFCEHILGEKAGHFFDDKDLCHCSWHYQIESPKDLEIFLDDLAEKHIAILIQSNLNIEIGEYYDILKDKGLVN